MPKKTLGDNPLDALIGRSPAPEQPAGDRHKQKPTSFRLPEGIVADMRAIALQEGVEVSQVVAYALASFVQRYRAGEKLPMRQRTIREVDLPP